MFKKFIKNEKGNIALAVVVALFASISGFAIAAIALEDSVASLKQIDSIQAMHLLRSELNRGQRYVASITLGEGDLTIPKRDIEINAGDYNRTYITWGKGIKGLESGGLNTKASEQFVFAKVQAFKGTGKNRSFVHYNPKDVEAYKFGAKTIRKETFAGFMYLTNTDESVNGDEVRFWGPDTIYGRLHSNTDIQLQNAGGGWPTFHGLATTAGKFVAQTGQIPYEEVFLDGYKEEIGKIVFNPTAEEARRGNHSFNSSTFDIVMVKVVGMSAECITGMINELPPDTLYIYDSYPPYGPVGNQVDYNYLALPDTIWSHMSMGAPQNTSEFVDNADLWIKGEITGAQTWAAEGDIYLLDDITYSRTVPGFPPDGYNPETKAYDFPINEDDFLGVVSEGKILIKYGWVDRWLDPPLRVHPNCGTVNEGGSGPGSNGIILYGAYCALGDGQGESHLDGEFGFEYHYPHLSTGNVEVGQEEFTYIDLHLCKFPPDNPPFWPEIPSGFSYPFGINVMPDYPWYNPLWPEGIANGQPNGLPYRERGRIELFGAVSQQRRGFVHRSGTDPMDQGRWELEEFMYGPLGCNPPAGSNAPGGNTRGGIGYGKDYHYDNRFISNPPPNFPEVHVEGGETPFKGIGIKVFGPNVRELDVPNVFN